MRPPDQFDNANSNNLFFCAGLAEGRLQERKAIVRWLKAREKYGYAGYPAVAIEVGEHLK